LKEAQVELKKKNRQTQSPILENGKGTAQNKAEKIGEHWLAEGLRKTKGWEKTKGCMRIAASEGK